MVGWNSVFGDLEAEPVKGEAASYEAAGGEARRLSGSLDEIGLEFVRITSSGDLTELRGETADRLVHLVTEIHGSLADVPAVFNDLDGLFSRHAEQLVALQQRASDGLARARARWGTAEDARADHRTGLARLNSIQSQLQFLRGSADDLDTVSSIEMLERDLWRQEGVVADCQQWESDARAELDLSRGEYFQLVDTELELVTTTIQAIGRISLGDLRDPNRIAQFASDIVDGLVHFGRDAVEAIIDDVLDFVRSLAAIAEVAITESLRLVAVSVKGILLSLIAVGTGVLKLLSSRFPPPRTSGDLAGGYTVRTSTDPNRAAHAVSGSDDVGVGLNTILATLSHTSDEAQIFTDEFELITITNNRFIVVLPGVTDLSRPHFGLDPHSRTVRDLDQFALESNASVGVDGNRYAQMVMEAMTANGVPIGADVMLVGHSFGADTALDLAADVGFNGPGGFNVTHAVAAAYDCRPQMPFVPSSTEVLVLQNNRDAAILAEHAGTPITTGVNRFMGGLDRIIARDPLGGIGDIVSSGGTIAHAHAPVDQLVPRVDTLQPGHTQIVFAGGGAGVGHAQQNYLEYLGATDEPVVRDFAASVGAAGYGDHGSIVALDISVPAG